MENNKVSNKIYISYVKHNTANICFDNVIKCIESCSYNRKFVLLSTRRPEAIEDHDSPITVILASLLSCDRVPLISV